MALTAQAVQEIDLGRGGSYSLSRDVIKHYVWDTRYFGTSCPDDFTFFTQNVGAGWRFAAIKSINETNLYSAGHLPNGQTFLAKRIGISCIALMATADTDAQAISAAFINVLQTSVLEFTIAGREWDFQTHMCNFLPALAVHGQTATNQTFRAGDTIASGWISFDSCPIFIDQLVNFSAYMRVNNPGTGVKVVVDADLVLLNGNYATLQLKLEGILTRAK